ncbi:MAG: Asp-tRNA(Asn)/Glu-tRNA(Gln) amidotransferase subunit GatA [Clostridiales bacterium]|jgi:aspartyl-tRNA(Asn)/glutamyl-tRNA(Gln) amidotransferase subunit A|nr:Asp-tRNA(Asn)/Glu-tRNA(Gln) amidotransferase subunit GatA [Clostridiales bacterium]
MDGILKKSLIEVRDMIKTGKVTSLAVTQAALRRVDETASLNAFNYVCREQALARASEIDAGIAAGKKDGALLGVPIAVKDNLCTEGIPTTASSAILEGFIPPYNATVTEKLLGAGAVIIGKTNMDEFAMGSSNETSYFGPVLNPRDNTRVPGGSSGGSAASVAAYQCYGAIGSDTGGSIRQPAAFCGVVGVKPTYGKVSRYGGIALASSFDQFGTFARSVDDAAYLLSVISGHDDRDMTSMKDGYVYKKPDGRLPEGFRVAVPNEFVERIEDKSVRTAFSAAVGRLTAAGAEVEYVSMPILDYSIPTYYILICAEATSNLSRYDGIKYGKRAKNPADLLDLYEKTRTEFLGVEVKRRLMLGNYALSSGYFDAYYRKAQKVRTLIRNEIRAVFGRADVILTPTAPTTAFGFNAHSGPLETYLSDIFTVPANLAGCAAMSVPDFGAGALPVGIQIMADISCEDKMFAAAAALER